MSKRMIGLLAAALVLLTAVSASAEIRIVRNDPRCWDERLNLRAEPNKAAQSLGRYYTGVRVNVLDETGEWSRVRIASGTGGTRVEGYMMSRCLEEVKDAVKTMLPYMLIGHDEAMLDAQGAALAGGSLHAGDAVYVMAFCGERVHALTTSGIMGYLPVSSLAGELCEPADAQRLERLWTRCTAEGAVPLRRTPQADGAIAATLYGGVRLDDVWAMASGGGQDDAPVSGLLVFLGDAQDEASGFLSAGSWTGWDNGTNCGCMYPVYQQDGELVEVLGRMADGRNIVRRGGAVTLEEEATLTGAVPLRGEPGDTTFFYDAPMKGEISDDEAIRCAIEGLIESGTQDEATGRALTRAALGAMLTHVIRAVQPQWGMTMLFVEFTDDAGARRAYAELWPDDGGFIAAGGNG